MKMKELERETGIGRETIRFYIREGLLPEPVRPKRNVADYGPQHVARLKLIRRLQQERFLPLSVIKTIVKAEASDPAAGFEAFIGLESRLGPLVSEPRNPEPMRLADVAEKTKVSVEDIRQFASFGFVHIEKNDHGEWLSPRNVRLIELIGESRASGFTEEDAGYTIEDFRIYAQMASVLAHHEVTQFYRNLGRRINSEDAARLAARGVQIVNEIMALLRTEKIIGEMERASVRGGTPDSEDD
ncbi:MAG: MerR family transcriptional regulator [Parvibaculum sp.]|uniref:MerR family transcriptional regulator n=1 Tax=Parvibaculum sp. TaxID=2024848 RepID=UPI003C750A90